MTLAKDVHHSTTARPTIGLSTSTVSGTDPDTHLIRLCLDLQLDAMLLAIGAAAASLDGSARSAVPGTEPAHHGGREDDESGEATTPPWLRWVGEDVQLACALAGDVMSGGAALPRTLGSELDHAVPAAAMDNLIARYESMAALLGDVLRSASSGGSSDPDQSQHVARLGSALARCEQRLVELRKNRLEHTPPRGINLSALPERPSLPGEWLG